MKRLSAHLIHRGEDQNYGTTLDMLQLYDNIPATIWGGGCNLSVTVRGPCHAIIRFALSLTSRRVNQQKKKSL